VVLELAIFANMEERSDHPSAELQHNGLIDTPG
jgi:hypothetical protein